MQPPAELLGSFYLGAEYNLQGQRRTPNAVHYDARDLTTHAVCIGMTGSGKTGLCLGLLEEAAIDGIPALIIDPKGGMTNLLLQFPALQAGDFAPWVDPDAARRQGQSTLEYAATIAARWRDGLADWGISPERLRLLQDAADFAIYTPGSSAGLPISILGSLAAPGLDFDAHAETLRERISGTVAALLGLVGVQGDPLRSREAILLANVLEHFWRKNQNLDLATLITSIQNPPLRRLGVLDVDTFYPEKERFELAMAFNNLMAAPSFRAWIEGQTLDVQSLLYSAEGQPRHSIFYLAHLSDTERMFFVTLLLESVVAWMRRQSGTSSLRALLYVDEIFGFFPATSAPPSKRPLLTLLKQARAVGLGCILAAQNPIDIDYKGLTNAGTWFIGQLQAKRDKERVLSGLKGAIAANQGLDYETLLSQLGQRLFLMHSVYQERPIVLQSRWAMSYLRGPLTKPQVQDLMAARRELEPAPNLSTYSADPRSATRTARREPEPAPDLSAQLAAARSAGDSADPRSASTPTTPPGFAPTPPALPPSVPQTFVPLRLSQPEALRRLSQDLGRRLDVQRVALLYEPAILGGAKVRFVDRKRKLDELQEKVLLAPPPDGLRGVDWESAQALPLRLDELSSGPETPETGPGPFFAPVPELANSERELRGIARDLGDWLYHHSRLPLTVHPGLELFQHPIEPDGAFKARLRHAARERRDAEVDALARKYDARIERLQTRLRKRERQLVSDEAEYDARRREARLTLGETALSFFMGRRRTRTVSTIARKNRLADQAKLDIQETEQEIFELEDEITALQEELEAATSEITARWTGLLDDLSTEELHPRRADVDVYLAALAWLPSWRVVYDDGMGAQMTTIAAYFLPG